MKRTRQESRPWWQGPLCISDVQFTPDEMRSLGPDGAAAKLADLGFNVHEQALPALPGYEGSYLRAPWKPEEYRAFFEACHDRNIRITPYLNVHGFYVELAEAHPDWPQRLPTGQPAVRGNGRWVPPCYNGPWREFALDAVGKMAREYPIDGIFLDGPAFYPQTCYCAHCKARFRQSAGLDLPEWGDWSDPAWPAFLRFRGETLARLLADIRKRLDEARPGEHLILYMNNGSLAPSWSHAHETRMMAPYLDVLGNERALLFSGPPLLTPLWIVGASVKILETQAQAHGQSTVQYCCFRHLPWDYYGLLADEYRVYVAGALANGAHPQVMGGWRYLDEPLQEVVRDLNRLQRAHPEVFCGSRSAADVALVWPQRTADFGGARTPMLATSLARIYPPPPPGAEPATAAGSAVALEEFSGWAEVLFRGGIPYDILDEAALEMGAGALARYAAVILPSAQCLSDASCAAIEEYVRRGGHLAATGTSSLCDEWDGRRPDFGLAGVFGASYGGRLLGPLPIDYLEISRGEWAEAKALLVGIARRVIPAPPTAVAVRACGATVLAAHLRKLLTRYEPLQGETAPAPAMLVNHYLSGTCAFLPGTFGAAYWQHRFPEYRRLLMNAVLWRCTPPVALTREGDEPPETIEVSWREAHGRWLLHLINHTGAMSRPIERLLPVRDLRVALPALAGKGKIRATVLASGAPLAVETQGTTPFFVLPRLDSYEIIILSTD